MQINDLIKEIVDLSAQMARYNKVIIATELQPGLPYVCLAPSEMQQVMLNLINNAIDAMEKTGGTINVGTKISKLEENHIVITVEDDGPGIPEANLKRMPCFLYSACLPCQRPYPKPGLTGVSASSC